MAKYAIRIKETLARTVIVDAEDLENALQQTEDAVSSDKIILDVDDFDDREIEPADWTENGLVPEHKDVSYYYQLYQTTRINYLYRDASNYKKLNYVIVPGRYSDEQIQAIISSLFDGGWFIPSKVGFPEVKIDDEETEDDHPWFELCADDFENSNEAPQIDKTPEEIVQLFLDNKEHWEEGIYE